MAEFIARKIIEAFEISDEDARLKYKAYFSTKLYENYRADVDIILKTEGYPEL